MAAVKMAVLLRKMKDIAFYKRDAILDHGIALPDAYITNLNGRCDEFLEITHPLHVMSVCKTDYGHNDPC
jgi:hypothetical protein